MAVSLNTVCRALGVSGRVSFCGHILGFLADQNVPAPLNPDRPRSMISLTDYVHLLKVTYFNVQIIIAGSDLLNVNDRKAINYAIYRLRDIYRMAGIGVARVTRVDLTAANSQGHATVSTQADILQTGTDITTDGDFIPVVLPANMNVSVTNPNGTVSVTLGQSPIGGPCSPRTGPGQRSSVVGIQGEGTGRTLAHEVGHFLGAQHPATPDNSLMTQTGSVPSGNAFDAVSINAGDEIIMLRHCAMHPGLELK